MFNNNVNEENENRGILKWNCSEDKRGEVNFRYERDLNIEKGCTYNDIEIYKLKNENKELKMYKFFSQMNDRAMNEKYDSLSIQYLEEHNWLKKGAKIINNMNHELYNRNLTICDQQQKIENLTTISYAGHDYYHENEYEEENYIELDSNDFTIR